MFTFFKYELRAWLRSPLPYILLSIITLLVIGATSSENVSIGGGVGSVNKNAPSVIQSLYGAMSVLGLLIATAFMNGTAMRDFDNKMDGLIFTKPINKASYFFGKFFGAYVASLIPLLGVTIGAIAGPMMPWATSDRYSEIILSGHLSGFLGFALPNMLLGGVLLYSLSMIFRSAIVSWIGAMLLLVFLSIAGGLSADIDNQFWASMMDPFGENASSIVGKYRTVEENNLGPIPISGYLLTNRLIWSGVGLLILTLTYTRFSFTLRSSRKSKKKSESQVQELESITPSITEKPKYTIQPGNNSWATFKSIFSFELRSIIRNPTFLILIAIGTINLLVGLYFFSQGYGVETYPVTYSIIDQIQGGFYLFLIAIIIFYSGVLVFRDRDVHIDEIKDATPYSSGLYLIAKVSALISAVALILASTIVVGICTQLINGFYDIKPGVYLMSVMVLDLFNFIHLAILAIFFHYILNNKYLAYFVFVLFLILNSFIWGVLEINSNMLQFGGNPSFTYSDMNGYGPFLIGNFWFNLYWTLFCVVLLYFAYGFYLRGREKGRKRWNDFSMRLKSVRTSFVIVILLFVLTAAFVFYNTQIINDYDTRKTSEQKQLDYELTYKKYENLPTISYYHLEYDLNLFPKDRNLDAHILCYAYNRSGETISELHFTDGGFSDSLVIEVENGEQTLRDRRLGYRIFTLNSPLQNGDSILITVHNYVISRGFENEVSLTQVTQNGSFFNNSNLLPNLGYQSGYEISDKNKRKKKELPAKNRMHPFDPSDTLARMKNYIDADWVSMKAKFSTDLDQIAIAPGSLKKEYTVGDRRFFEYELDHKALNFFSFMSARYEVEREKWNGIDIEIYHIPEHSYNVENMKSSLKKSLAYYTREFGPYYQKQARIIEFPRYSSFAQAFAGTMPYSEGIGFIYDLRDMEEDKIDMAFYVVAHEMGHQWWAHQLVGASMQGSEMMSESFAQYSALMVMEEEYGRDKMKKFLKYESDRYLSGRSSEREAERPLMKVESQGYIHYPKGSLVMYYLKEMIGEENVNQALKSLINQFAYKEPPYATSKDAVDAFRSVTPDSLQYIISDLFENITLFSNRVDSVYVVSKGANYEVLFTTLSEKVQADSLGGETAVDISDYVDIAVFGESDGELLGKALIYKRMKISQEENTYRFTVKEKPGAVGIDPYNYIIDRLPDDNTKSVTSIN